MRIVDVHQLINGEKIRLETINDDMLIFLDEENHCKRYSGIYKHNYETQYAEKFNFKKTANLVSHTNAGSFIYYACIDKNKDNYWISLYKINFINWTEEEILSFDTGVSCIDEKYYIWMLESRITCINEKYVMIAIPACGRKYGEYNYSKMLLINSDEKKLFEIQDKIINSDTILRLDNAWIVGNEEYIVLKTGKIMQFEKKMIFESKNEKGICDKYYDSVETLVVCKVDEFIKNIEKGNLIDRSSIIEEVDQYGALNVVEISNNIELIYSINSFTNNTVQLTTLNIESCKKNIIKLENCYEQIIYANNKFFGLLQEDESTSIYDIYGNKKIFNTDKKIVHVDEQNIITFNFDNNPRKKTITIYKLVNDKIIDTVEYNGTNLYFDYQKNILVIY